MSCIAAAVSVCCVCVVLEIGTSRKGRYKWNNMQKAFGTVFSVKVSFDYLHLLQVDKGIFGFSKKKYWKRTSALKRHGNADTIQRKTLACH